MKNSNESGQLYTISDPDTPVVNSVGDFSVRDVWPAIAVAPIKKHCQELVAIDADKRFEGTVGR